MAQCRLADPKDPGEVADAELVREGERMKDARARGVREELERAHHPPRVADAEHAPDQRTDVLRVQALDRAAVECRA